VEIESQWIARDWERLGILPDSETARHALKAPAFAKNAKGWATRGWPSYPINLRDIGGYLWRCGALFSR
jgi:hypothetical protein